MNLQTVPERFRVGFGLAGALAIAGLTTVVLAYGQGAYDNGFEVTAVFPTSSQGLFTDGGSAVKLRGLNVGEVSGIELLPDGRARVTLFLHEGTRVPDSAMASIEPLSIFGPKFVLLEPGAHETAGPYLGDGDEIPHTQTQRELTDILAATTELFEHLDPLDLVITIDAIAEGTSGLGPHIGRTIDASGALAAVAADHAADIRQFLGDVALLSGTFAEHADDILAIGADLDALVDAALQDPDRLEQLLDSTTAISSTFARLLRDNEDELDTTIRSVGSFIADISVEADQIPEFVDMLGTFFGRLSDVIRFDGPSETRMAGLRGFISLDLCLVYGVCPLGVSAAGAPTASPTGAGVSPGDVADARALRAMADATPPAGRLVEFAAILTGAAR
jgi:phospholipid/cholesterol/gamma-HCH transport system substrate-binding protein